MKGSVGILFWNQKIMDGLIQEYRETRRSYQRELEEAARDPSPSKRVPQLVQINRMLSQVVNRMQAEFAKLSDKVNLDDVQTRLSRELTDIQRDAQRFRSTRDQRETIQRIFEQSQAQASKNSQSLFVWLAALLVAVVLLLVAILRATWIGLSPAMPPLASPTITSGTTM